MIRNPYGKIIVFLFIVLFLGLVNIGFAIEKKAPAKKSKRPPLLVTTVQVQQGSIQSMFDFIGTTYFARVSRVATDIEGLLTRVNFNEGDTVKKGEELVLLDSQLLEAEITAARAAYEQNLVDLDNARSYFKRINNLYSEGSISETDFDSYRSKQLRLEKQSSVLEAKHNKLLIARDKKSIKAPFAGTVVQKPVEVSEWVPKGGIVAVIADNSIIEIKVDVPIEIIQNLKQGIDLRVIINSREYIAKYKAFIPMGDIATRTFTAKFNLLNPKGLVEGLEALVSLPGSGETKGMLLPRDAIVDKYGKTMVFRVIDNKAVEVQVKVAGYLGLQAVVTGAGLLEGQEIVLKGAKRVEDGMSLQFR